MSLPPDYHLHTPLCHHATGEPTEYAARALAVGLTEVGFSDHAPMREDDFDHWRMNIDRLDDYVERVERARCDYPSLTIRLGLEVDYLPGQEDWIGELAARQPWDYFIGSVHYVAPGWAIDDPGRVAEWTTRDPDEIWALYFERLTQAAATGLFDIIGHADLPKKFGFQPRRDPTPWFERFVEAASAARVAVELNTAGLRKECREIYPTPALLQLAHRRGIPISFGSDAHAIGEVGLGLTAAVALARKVGYTSACCFERRQRRLVPL